MMGPMQSIQISRLNKKGQHSANCASPQISSDKRTVLKEAGKDPTIDIPIIGWSVSGVKSPQRLEVDYVEPNPSCTTRFSLGVLQVVQALADWKARLSQERRQLQVLAPRPLSRACRCIAIQSFA
jgi:hypothetical protein